MSGVVDTLKLNLEQFADYAREAGRTLEGMEYTVPLKAAKLIVVGDIRENFQGAHAPDGTTWDKLKRPRTLPRSRRKSVKARRRRTGETDRPLRDSGRMMAASTTEVKEELGPYTLILTNVLDYAAHHQYGAPRANIPARPFMGISNGAADRIQLAFAEYVMEKL